MLWLAYFFALFACATIAFYVLCLVGAWSWLHQSQANAVNDAVTVLKPLKGCEPGIYESLRSHCVQEYSGAIEIIFGVSDALDEAVPYVERLKQEFPEIPIQLVICDKVLGANRKVSNLVQMITHARHGFVLVNDGDIRVERDYLAKVMAAFTPVTDTTRNVGLVTCLYRAMAMGSVWSRLEALGITVEFINGTLVSRLLESGVKFGLGSTLCMRREALEMIGGFAVLVDHLADDYELAKRIIHAGYSVALPNTVVETHVHDYDFAGFWSHQLRWLRTIRSCRPAGYPGLTAMYGVFWAALAVMFSGSAKWCVWLFCGVLLMQWINYVVFQVYVLAGEFRLGDLFLLLLRDIVAPLLWLVGLFGDRIEWRGEIFRLENGILHHAEKG
jgi:ceramide glucosyltransferase